MYEGDQGENGVGFVPTDDVNDNRSIERAEDCCKWGTLCGDDLGPGKRILCMWISSYICGNLSVVRSQLDTVPLTRSMSYGNWITHGVVSNPIFVDRF